MPLLTTPWTCIRYRYFREKSGQKKGFVTCGIGCLNGRFLSAAESFRLLLLVGHRWPGCGAGLSRLRVAEEGFDFSCRRH
jgi:hypothetical protein